ARLRFETQYPGINGIGVIIPVGDKADEQRIIAREKRSGISNFAILPINLGSPELLIPNPEVRWIVDYIEPMAQNEKAIGILISSEKHRYEAAQRSRDTGLPTITDQIRLVQDQVSRPGFI